MSTIGGEITFNIAEDGKVIGDWAGDNGYGVIEGKVNFETGKIVAELEGKYTGEVDLPFSCDFLGDLSKDLSYASSDIIDEDGEMSHWETERIEPQG